MAKCFLNIDPERMHSITPLNTVLLLRNSACKYMRNSPRETGRLDGQLPSLSV